MDTGSGGSLSLGTHFVGVMVLAIGTVLMVVGYLAGRPWSKKDHST
jgi:uncharacterized membrane protein